MKTNHALSMKTTLPRTCMSVENASSSPGSHPSSGAGCDSTSAAAVLFCRCCSIVLARSP